MSIFEISQRPIWTASSSPQSHIDTRLGLDNECHVVAPSGGLGAGYQIVETHSKTLDYSNPTLQFYCKDIQHPILANILSK